MSVTSVTSFFVSCCVISFLILLSATNFSVMILICSACLNHHFVNLSCLNISFVNLSVSLIASFFSFSKKLLACSKRDHEFLDIADFLSYLSSDLIVLKYFKILSNLSFENAEKIHLILIKLHKMKNYLNKQLHMLECVYYDD
jgi:hypothetical protein